MSHRAQRRTWAFAPFSEDTDYWPAAKQGMVNFTVRDPGAMLEQLRAAGTLAAARWVAARLDPAPRGCEKAARVATRAAFSGEEPVVCGLR